MHSLIPELRRVPGRELVARLVGLRGEERNVTARAVAHIAEVERRELHLALGYASLFGVRCTEREGLEFHHTDPWAAGGAGTAAKVELRCRRHDQYEARLFFERDADGAPWLERPARWSAPRGPQLGLEPVATRTVARVTSGQGHHT